MRNFRITVDGKPYVVSVEELDAVDGAAVAAPTTAATPPSVKSHVAPTSPGPGAATPPPATGPAARAGVGDVASPLAGTVVGVEVAVGQVVHQGEAVVVLEAMKMNTHVTASRSGTVTAIYVKPGETVSEGQILLSTG